VQGNCDFDSDSFALFPARGCRSLGYGECIRQAGSRRRSRGRGGFAQKL